MKLFAENVSDICVEFLKKSGYSFIKITSLNFSQGRWNVTADVGAIVEIKKTIVVDDENGKVIEYG